MLMFFDEAQRAHRRARIDRIDDVNAGHAGGKHAQQLKQDLED